MPRCRAWFGILLYCASFFLFLAATQSAPADEVLLSGGGRITGDVVAKDDRQVILQTAYGRVTFRTADITEVRLSSPVEKEIRSQLVNLPSTDTSGRIRLASRAESSGLGELSKSIFTQVIAIDPDDKTARKALGYILFEDEWVTPEEKERHPGVVPYKGRWITSAERDELRRNDTDRSYFAAFGLSAAQGQAFLNTIGDIDVAIEPRGGFILRRHVKSLPVKDKPYYYSVDILNWQRLGAFIGVTFLDQTRHRVHGFGTLQYTIYAVKTDTLGNRKVDREIFSTSITVTPAMWTRQSDFNYWDAKVNSTFEEVTADSARAAWSDNYYFNFDNILYVLANRDIDLLVPPNCYYVEAVFTVADRAKKVGKFVQYAELR